MPLRFAALAALALGSVAYAQDSDLRAYTWDVTLQGQHVGTRTLTVETVETAHGTTRILKSLTDINASLGAINASFRQRLTAHASDGPASFHAAIDQAGNVMEVQGRKDQLGWIVTTVDPRRVRTNELASDTIDLSTADLFDPESRVPIWSYDNVMLLRTEDGVVWPTPVERLGSDEITIQGQAIEVEGYRLDPDPGRIELWYDGSGVLVRYRWRWLTVNAVATLREAPAQAADAFPVLADESGISEEEI